jgi:2'-5' RNA ligase
MPDSQLPSARLNVALPLAGALAQYARRVNRRLVDEFGSLIVFEPDGDAYPHVTLFMGDYIGPRDRSPLREAIDGVLHDVEPFTLSVGAPYFRDRARRYLFVDADQDLQLRSLRRRLEAELSDFFRVDHYGGAENVSHLTLGFLPSGGRPGLEKEVEAGQSEAEWINEAALFLTGPRGTCVERLDTYRLRSGGN